MSATKTRQVSSLLKARYGIDDPQLCYEIVQAVLTPDAAPGQYKWGHPAIKLAKAITGKQVPSAIFDEVIEKLGETPDEKRARACYAAQVKRGYADAWWWLDDYAGTAKKPSSAPAPSQPAYVYEWRE